MIIRVAVAADCPAILEIYNYYVLNETCTYQDEPDGLADRQQWFEHHGPLHPIIVAEENGQVIGWGSLSKFHPRSAYRFTVEDSIYLHHGHRGKRIGPLLLQELIHRAKTIGHRSIVAVISADQAAGIRLHEKFGFVPAGLLKGVGNKFAKWLDVAYLQLELK